MTSTDITPPGPFSLFAIYANLPAHPDCFVVQEWRLEGATLVPVQPVVAVVATLEEARAELRGLTFIPRVVGNPRLVELWA